MRGRKRKEKEKGRDERFERGEKEHHQFIQYRQGILSSSENTPTTRKESME